MQGLLEDACTVISQALQQLTLHQSSEGSCVLASIVVLWVTQIASLTV